MTNITESLKKHHAYCDEFFIAAENAAQEKKWANCKVQFALFVKAMEAHFLVEETILFPAFEQETGMTDGPTMMMRTEHTQMRELLDQIAQAVTEEDGDGFSGSAETLLILMQQHNMKEENILYPMCDQTLNNKADDIGRQLAAYLELA